MEENDKIRIDYDFHPNEVVKIVNECLKSKGLKFEQVTNSNWHRTETFILISIAKE